MYLNINCVIPLEICKVPIKFPWEEALTSLRWVMEVEGAVVWGRLGEKRPGGGRLSEKVMVICKKVNGMATESGVNGTVERLERRHPKCVLPPY